MVRVTRSLPPAGGDETQLAEAPPPAATVDDFAPGTLVADKLRIVRQVGAGGMGAVYEVQHIFTKHDRALKVMHPSFASRADAVERFLREASAAGRIGSPHIVDTFDAGQLASGAPFIVMELLRGQPLDQLLKERGRLPVHEAIALVRQACAGAQAAHDAGIVHRDLKPQNLFAVVRDGRPFVKLVDFGISKFDPVLLGDRPLTQEGSQLGTPFYMAPEQLAGKDVGTQVDVHALGIILYECVAGKRPFEGQSLPELSIRIHQGEYVSLEQLVPDLPPGFVDIVRRAMHHDPSQRFASPRELSERLAGVNAVEGLVDTSFSPSDSKKSKRPVLLYLAALVTIGAGIGYGVLRARSEQSTAAPVASSAATSIVSDSQKKREPAANEDVATAAKSPAATGVPSSRAIPRASADETRSKRQKLSTENPY